MITIAETDLFKAAAKKALSQDQLDDAISVVARNPKIGDLIQGTGGIRKVRVALEGRGKSGGARVIYYYHNDALPVFFLTVFAKGEKDNLTKAERNALAKIVKMIADNYGART